jgi:hypothetical protein
MRPRGAYDRRVSKSRSFRVPGSGVRPTRRALDDLGIALPPVGVSLEGLDHDLIIRAQQLPETIVAGGAERIRSLDDLTWFKIKAETWRGAGTSATPPNPPEEENDGPYDESWWIGAAGERRADSSQDDFYDRLQSECYRRRSRLNESGTTSTKKAFSEHLLPQVWDAKRLKADLAFAVKKLLQTQIRNMAVESLRTGRTVCLRHEQFGDLRVLIRARSELAYIAVAASAIRSPELFALLLSSIPGIAVEDWGSEPDGVANLKPNDGEILWSAVLPPDAQTLLFDDEE